MGALNMPIDPSTVTWDSTPQEASIAWDAPPAPPQVEIDPASAFAANPFVRFATAAGSPFMALGEFAPGEVGKWFAENNRRLKQMVEEGKIGQSEAVKIAGAGADLAGTIMSPAFLKFAKMLPTATTVGSLVKQGAMTGALGGAMTPTGETGEWEDRLIKKAQMVGADALLGGVATPIVGSVFRAAGNMLAPTLSKTAAERGAARLGVKAAGDNAIEIADDLVRAGNRTPSGEIAGQLTAPRQSTVFAALQNEWSKHLPDQYNINLQEQQGLRDRAVAALARETEPARTGVLGSANRMTQAFQTAQQRGAEASLAATGAVDDVRRLQRAADIARGYDIAGTPTLGSGQRPVIGSGLTQAAGLAKIGEQGAEQAAERSLKEGAKARVATRLVGSWEDRGLRPLMADDLSRQLETIKTSPANVTNDTLRLILTKIDNAVKRATKPDGTIDAESLYTLRKTGIANIIDRLSNGNPDLAKRMSTGHLIDVKKAIDQMIEGAGGKGWRKYLTDYGIARNKIEAPLERMDQMGDLAKLGGREAARLTGGEYRWTPINFLNPVVSVFNAGMRAAEGVAGESVAKAGARLTLPENARLFGQLMQNEMQNPKGVLDPLVKYQAGLFPYAYDQLGLTPYTDRLLTGEQQ